MHAYYHVLLLLLFLAIRSFSLCSYIPTSFSDAEIALENGEIDTLCFIQYRSLLLTPVNPLLEGWRELQELDYELDSRSFPDYRDLLLFQNNKKALLDEYPWLVPYASLFTLSQDSTTLPVTISLKSEIIADFHGGSRSAVKTMVREKRKGSRIEVAVAVKENDVKPTVRNSVVVLRDGLGHISLGNFVLAKNSLVWGAFEPFHSDTADQYQWLYGTRRSWNGGAFQIDGAKISGGASGHIRYSERGGHGFTELHLNRISFKLLGGYQENKYGTTGVMQFAGYSPKGMVQITRQIENGISLLANYTINSEQWKSEGELWYMSRNFALPFSQKCYELERLFDRTENKTSASGWTVRTGYKPGRWQIRFTFDGVLLDRQGVSDNKLGIRRSGVVPFGVTNRIRFLYRYGVKDQLWEQRADCKPGIFNKKIEFPVSGNSVVENGRWQRASCNLGVLFNPERGKYHLEWFQKWYDSKNSSYGIRSSMSQQIGEKGRGALLLTLPFENDPKVVVQAVVEISI